MSRAGPGEKERGKGERGVEGKRRAWRRDAGKERRELVPVKKIGRYPMASTQKDWEVPDGRRVLRPNRVFSYLNSEKDLLDRDTGLPRLLFVQNAAPKE